MKTFLAGLGLVFLIAVLLELPGLWWAMPLAGLTGGYWVRQAGKGFLAGGLGVALAWGAYFVYFAATSPLGALANLFASILGLPQGAGFAPIGLALLVAFSLGGMGGLCGGFLRQIGERRTA